MCHGRRYRPRKSVPPSTQLPRHIILIGHPIDFFYLGNRSFQVRSCILDFRHLRCDLSGRVRLGSVLRLESGKDGELPAG